MNKFPAVKVSNKGRYAIRAIFDIAFYGEGRATQGKDIADRQDIPPRFLEQIFQDLKRAGLIGTKRGPQGGYSLARPSDAIRLGDILRITEGPVALSEGNDSQPPGTCRQVVEAAFEDLSTQVESCFDSITIGDLCSRAHAMGVVKPGERRYSYQI